MEIALGVSMTPTTVRMALVEGDKADGLTMDCDQFALTSAVGTPSASASEQVSAAILATEESASSRGHHLCTCGIALSRECDADELQASLDARDVADVILVSELQAAAALAHAVARARRGGRGAAPRQRRAPRGRPAGRQRADGAVKMEPSLPHLSRKGGASRTSEFK